MKSRVVILGAGFGGLELATTLSEAVGDKLDITLIDKSDHFIFGFAKLDILFGLFGFAKLDILFGHETTDSVKLYYRDFVKPGVRLAHETVTAIDPAKRRVTTDAGVHDADYLVIALGADYDVSGTPGITLGENEFYTVEGANRLRDVLPKFAGGDVVIGVCHAPYKCPPAPSECALILHDLLVERGLRDRSTIKIVNPMSSPVPPSPETAKALLASFAERGIEFMANRRVVRVDTAACRLFLGVPKSRAPDVVVAAGLTEDGWVTIDKFTLETKFPFVYALGDLANTGAPKAGLFAEVAAKTVAANVLAHLRGEVGTARNPGAGACYIEFGGGRVARVEVDFYSGPTPVGTFHAPTAELRADKEAFGTTRRARWFGR